MTSNNPSESLYGNYYTNYSTNSGSYFNNSNSINSQSLSGSNTNSSYGSQNINSSYGATFAIRQSTTQYGSLSGHSSGYSKNN